jgi:hypothetical protein
MVCGERVIVAPDTNVHNDADCGLGSKESARA